MPKLKGNLVAVRPRTIESRRGAVQSYQAAYIPAGDPHDFPAVVNVTVEVYGQLSGHGGEEIEMLCIETPPYGDKLVTQVGFSSSVKVA